jgi:hypothetical protein
MVHMRISSLTIDRDNFFLVRPLFLLTCFGLLLMFLLPDAIRGNRTGHWLLFIFGSLAVILGWFFYFGDHENASKWRELISLLTALYLTASIPVYFFEFSPVKWFMRGHIWPSLYVRPWVHWGFIFVYLGIVGSLFGRGRARIAFASGSILLTMLWESMARWIF